MILDLTAPTKDEVLRLLNTQVPSPHVLTFELVEFGIPSVSDAVEGKNTALLVTAKQGRVYSGQETVFYTRPSLSSLSAFGPAELPPIGDYSTANVLSAINQEFGIVLSELDVTVSNVSSGIYMVMRITAKPDSYAWIGQLDVVFVEGALVTESGDPVLTEDGQYIVPEQ